jgi:hypothetical protein
VHGDTGEKRELHKNLGLGPRKNREIQRRCIGKCIRSWRIYREIRGAMGDLRWKI